MMLWIGDGSVRTGQQTKAAIQAWERDWQRWRIEVRSASITYMIRHYAAEG